MELPFICKTLHKRAYKCNKCDYSCNSLWNLKKHTAEHISIREKNKLPFYCKMCDSLSISQEYYEKHLESDSHVEKTIGKDIKNYIDMQIDARMKEYGEEK